MSETCVYSQCKRISRALCKCCQQDLCLQHFWQHNDSIITQLNTLKKEINEVDCRYQFLDLPKSTTNFRQQLKQWRIDSYTMIDRFYDEKCQEFNQFIRENVERQREDIERLQKQVDHFVETEFGNQEDFDAVKSNIQELNKKLDQIEQTPSPILILPLTIDDNLIRIRP